MNAKWTVEVTGSIEVEAEDEDEAIGLAQSKILDIIYLTHRARARYLWLAVTGLALLCVVVFVTAFKPTTPRTGVGGQVAMANVRPIMPICSGIGVFDLAEEIYRFWTISQLTFREGMDSGVIHNERLSRNYESGSPRPTSILFVGIRRKRFVTPGMIEGSSYDRWTTASIDVGDRINRRLAQSEVIDPELRSHPWTARFKSGIIRVTRDVHASYRGNYLDDIKESDQDHKSEGYTLNVVSLLLAGCIVTAGGYVFVFQVWGKLGSVNTQRPGYLTLLFVSITITMAGMWVIAWGIALAHGCTLL